MNKVTKNLKIILWFLIVSCTAYAQNQPANSTQKATFTIDKNSHDYGTIPEDGGLASHTFIITNTGKTPLVINKVVASCGCTSPDWTKTPIAPGKTGEVKIAYNPQGRPGAFKKVISVHCNNADPVQLVITGTVGKNTADTPRIPVFAPTKTSHDFGTIGENDGYAQHIFTFKNTGGAPLVISRVTASCGCTKPEWPQQPIQPGQEGSIIIMYNPQGRPGNFNKTATVYTNESDGYKRHTLTIHGVVIDKPSDKAYVQYVDTIGNIGIEKKNITHKVLNNNELNKDLINIKNYNTEAVYFSWDNVPDHITINGPESLKADWPGEVYVIVDGSKTSEKRGRITDKFGMTVKDGNGNILGRETFTVTANYLDDFSTLSPLQKISASSIEINNTRLEFGVIKKGKVVKEFVITNSGKSNLIIHSLSSEDPRVVFPDVNGKTIEAGASLTVKVTIKAKDLNSGDINTDIYVVSNAPKTPVRMILVTAKNGK